MKIGELIKQYRSKYNMSQREFALKCGLSNGIISLIEKGVNPQTNEPIIPTLPTLNSIAKGMGINIDELLEQIDDMDVSLSRTSVAEQNSLTSEYIKLFSALPEDKQILVLDIIKGFLFNDEK